MTEKFNLLTGYTFEKRIILPALCTLIILSLVMFLYIVPQFRGSIIERKKELIHEQVNTVWSMLRYYHNQETRGTLTRSVAQQKAIEHIRELRYGREMKDYFWINDTLPVMVMHPYRSGLDGQNVTDFSDPQGKKLFSEFVKTVSEEDEGFVDYMWQWKDDSSRVVPKISFVKGFKPWGWVVGSGMYIQDVEAEMAQIIREVIISIVGTLLISVLIMLYTIRHGLAAERERLAAVDALQESAEQYRNLSEHSSDYISRYDSKGHHIYMNTAALELANRNPNEILNRTHRELGFNPDQCQVWEDAIKRVFASGLPERVEYTFTTEEKRILHLDWRVVPECNDQGEVYAALGVARDITEIRAAEKKLGEFNSKLKLANQALIVQRQELEEFLHTVSHDLKAPIISIQGFSQLLKARLHDIVDESARSYLERISLNCRTIETLLNDLLELSRIGRIDEGLEVLSVESITGEIVTSCSSVLERKNIVVKIENDIPEICGRPNRIRQVLANLLDNSIKYMPPRQTGVIEIGSIPQMELNKEHMGVFFVRDNGEGIAEKHHAKIFKMFQRARDLNDPINGTGAGLAIVRKVVENHNGQVWLESQPGQGATFFFTLPLSEVLKVPEQEECDCEEMKLRLDERLK